MRILGGKAKGFVLHFPQDKMLLRPTATLLRRRFFDTYQKFRGVVFVDLCAGTGSMGLEAWSRQAAQVYLVEKNRSAGLYVQKNLNKLQEKFSADHLSIYFRGAQSFLNEYAAKLIQQPTTFFLDPPYADLELYQQVFSSITKLTQHPEMRLAVEADQQKIDLAQLCSLDSWNVIKKIQQGSRFIAMMSKKV